MSKRSARLERWKLKGGIPKVLELVAWKPGLMMMLPVAVANAIDPAFAKQAQEIADAAIYAMLSSDGQRG